MEVLDTDKSERVDIKSFLTCPAQYVAILWDAASITIPRIQNPVIRRIPSARPQRSSAFAIGIYTAPVMADATILMTVKSE